MGWTRKVAVGAGAVLIVLVAAVAGLRAWRPWVPPVEMTDPAPDGRRVAEGDLILNYYPAAGAGTHPGVLLLGGSEGALGAGPTRIARALQGAGFSVAHLAYFRAPGQSPTLEAVPLELFDHGLAWLARQPGVAADRLAVAGGSKGAEAALLVASRHPELKAVVAGMPSSVVWPGINWEDQGDPVRASWSANGRPLAALAYGASGISAKTSAIYANGLKGYRAHPEARIPIEHARAQVLLVCGGMDSVWPSCAMARQLHDRDATRVRVLDYPKAGHGVFGPPLPEGDERIGSLAALGGTGEDNNAARADAWPKVVAFLKETLR